MALTEDQLLSRLDRVKRLLKAIHSKEKSTDELLYAIHQIDDIQILTMDLPSELGTKKGV